MTAKGEPSLLLSNNPVQLLWHCRCEGKQEFSLSVFEQHCSSNYKKPAEFIYLNNYEISLKELVQLVQVSGTS
jgi:hypothetical protein